MSALRWIKERATSTTDDPIAVEGITYFVDRLVFVGRLPSRMITQICSERLVSTDFRHETINIDRRNNRVEYCLTTYTAATSA